MMTFTLISKSIIWFSESAKVKIHQEKRKMMQIFWDQYFKLSFILYCFSVFSRYYETDALIADPVDGPIFASLLGMY